jgi:hypothetical protein
MGNNNVKPDNQNEVYNKINHLINTKTEGYSSEQYGGITFKEGHEVLLKDDRNKVGIITKEAKIAGEKSRAWEVTLKNTGKTEIWLERVMVNKTEEDKLKKKEEEAEAAKKIEDDKRKQRAEDDRIKREKDEAERKRRVEEERIKIEKATADSKRKAAVAEKERKIRELNQDINKNKGLIDNARVIYDKFQATKKDEFDRQIQNYNLLITKSEKELSKLQQELSELQKS